MKKQSSSGVQPNRVQSAKPPSIPTRNGSVLDMTSGNQRVSLAHIDKFVTAAKGNSYLSHWEALEVKAPSVVEKRDGKHQPMRKRDFTSQIATLPGPKTLTNRTLSEAQQGNWDTRKKYDVRKRDNQAFVCPIDDKFNGHKVDRQVFPSHLKQEQPFAETFTRKGYALDKFIFREKYDFLHPV